MTYQLQIDIDLPRDRVIELFDNSDNMRKWQPGLQEFTHLDGEPGQVGARSRLVYLMGKRKCEMIETVTRRSLPDEFCGTYETKGVWNSVGNRFVELEGGRTRWLMETEFKFSGFMKLVGFFMPGSFKKESFKFMRQFKDFAESEPANW